MIQPVSVSNLGFKGSIKQSESLTKALSYFSGKELAEFVKLRSKAMEINDGKVYQALKGCKYKTLDSDGFSKTESHYYIGLYDENYKPLSEEVYKVEVGSGKYGRVVSTDKNAFVKAILEPLRKIYNY